MTFSKGASLFEKEKEDRVSRSSSSNDLFSFFLKYEESKRPIVFLEDITEVRCQRIHRIFKDNRLINAVCTKDDGDCPLCDAAKRLNKNYSQVVAFFTVLDLKPFEKRDGSVVPATRKVLMATNSTYDLLRREIEDEMEGGSLEGAMFHVSRGPKKSPSPPAVGDQFRFRKYVDLSEIEVEDSEKEPFTIDQLSTLILSDPEKIADLAEDISPSGSDGSDDDSDIEVNV